MNTRKKNTKKVLKKMKSFLWIVLLAMLDPSNYTGHCANVRNTSNFPVATHNVSMKSSSDGMAAIMTNTKILEGSTTIARITLFPLFVFLTFAASTILNSLVLGYLSSNSLSRQCFLLYLYKDIVRIWMAITFMWFVAAAIRYMSRNEDTIDKLPAKIIFFVMLGLVLLILLFLNVSSAFELYMIKQRMIDPPMPWGTDEFLGIKITRFVTGSLVLGFICTMYAVGAYPKIYYTYIGDPVSLSELFLRGTMIITILVVLLLTTFTITSLTVKYYQRKHQDNIVTGAHYLFYPIVWMCSLSLVVLLLIESSNVFSRPTKLGLLEMAASLNGVLIILFVIVKTEQLRSYVKKNLENVLYEMMHLNVKFVCLCLLVYVLMVQCFS